MTTMKKKMNVWTEVFLISRLLAGKIISLHCYTTPQDPPPLTPHSYPDWKHNLLSSFALESQLFTLLNHQLGQFPTLMQCQDFNKFFLQFSKTKDFSELLRFLLRNTKVDIFLTFSLFSRKGGHYVHRFLKFPI